MLYEKVVQGNSRVLLSEGNKPHSTHRPSILLCSSLRGKWKGTIVQGKRNQQSCQLSHEAIVSSTTAIKSQYMFQLEVDP
jgi:hypothetical protein